MVHFYKVLTSLFLSGITFAVTDKQAGDFYLAGSIAGVVLLISSILLYGESNLFPKLKADVLFVPDLALLSDLRLLGLWEPPFTLRN